MKLTILLPILFISILSYNCNKYKFISPMIGKNLSENGNISESNLTYTIKRFSKKGKIKDLINYIYFEGDTLCFSLTLNREIKKNNIKVWFINPINNKKFSAERIEVINNRIFNIPYNSKLYGFSLIGSILEEYYYKDLDKTILKNYFCCKDIPVKLVFEISEEKKIINHEFSGYFRINYK